MKKWSSINNLKLGKIAEYYTKIEFLSHNYNIYSPVVDDHGIDLVVKNHKNEFYVQVKSLCKGNYVYILKNKIVLDKKHIVCFLPFKDDKIPDIYIIPATVWKTPNKIFVDRKKYKKPEYGINYSMKNIPLLNQFKADEFFMTY